MFIDFVGALFSLISTYYFIRLDVKAWPLGLIATGLNGWLYWHKGIYADMVLEGIYSLSMLYGWLKWRANQTSPHLNAPFLLGAFSPIQWLGTCLFFGMLFAVSYYILSNFTQSTIALLDATTTSLSLAAQWLMCHKIIATWILWFITDALYIAMYFGKSLPFHSFLMIIYTGMALAGYLVWIRQHKKKIHAVSCINLTLKDQPLV